MIYVLRGGDGMSKTQTKKSNKKSVKNNKQVQVNRPKNAEVKKVKKEEKVEIVEATEKEKVKKIVKKVFDLVFWIAITCLAIIWITDFIKLQTEEEPVFCLSEKNHKFEDGTVYECKGLGYNIYKYDRESIDVTHQFSPFFIGMKK